MPSIIRVIDSHTELADLTNGDGHPQYVLLAGRAGGQTLYGGTAANEDLTIQGTSHGTKTTSYVLLQPTGGRVGIRTSAPALNVDIAAISMLLGADSVDGISRTNATDKKTWLVGPHYLNAEEYAAIVGFSTGSTYSVVEIGGGTSDFNAATNIRFFTAANYNTVTGTERMRIESSGNVGIGTTAPISNFHVEGDSGVISRRYAGGALYSVYRANGSSSSPTAVAAGDQLGAVAAYGYDGNSYELASAWYFEADGAVSDGVVPGRIAARIRNAAGTLSYPFWIRESGRVGIGTSAPDSLLHASISSGNTSTVQQLVTLSANSTGTAAAGFGSRILWELESSTTDDQTACILDVQWSDATHATRTSRILLQLVNDASTSRWLHNHADATANGFNIFMGWGAGNFTLSPAGGAATLASDNVGIGAYVLDALTTGYRNTGLGGGCGSSITTGYLNTVLGYSSGYDIVDGYSNTLVGCVSGENITSGYANVAVGYAALDTCTTGTANVALGAFAGYYETGSNKLFIDNTARSDEAAARAKALVYGVFDAATANQTLALNAVVTVLEGLKITNGSAQIGGTAARSGTAGTNRLDIFDGTAPVGTLANGVSIYSTTGECYIMDAAGNATLQSPHDLETGEWIFWSRNTVTGRTYRVDMERMVAAIEALTGQSFTTETFESQPN